MRSVQIVDALPRLLTANTRRAAQDGSADDLTRRAVKGDRDAFSALMASHKEQLYRFVRRRTPDAEEAFDIVQEAFVSAWGAIGRFDPDRPFGAWLRSIALNKCRDRARRASVRYVILGSSSTDAAERVTDESPSPEDEVVARDELATLARALAALPSQLREALMLTAVDGMSQAAASAVLGCSVKSIEYRVHRAREILGRELASG